MKVKKLIGGRPLAIHLHGGVDDVKPGHRHRLVVAAGRHVLNMVGGVVGPDAGTKLPGGNVMAKAHRIKIGQLHMRAMMPLVEWKSATLELLDENIVVANRWSGCLSTWKAKPPPARGVNPVMGRGPTGLCARDSGTP